MTVTTTTQTAIFEGDDTADEFAFSFKVFAAADLEVILVSSAGVETTLVLDSDYSVSLNADQNDAPGGSVSYPLSGDALATGEKLVVLGSLTAAQSTRLRNAGGFFPQTVENALDKLTILVQQHAGKLARTLLASSADASSVLDLGTAANRASKFLSFDSDGDSEFAEGVTSVPLTQSAIGNLIFPEIAAETSSSISPAKQYTSTPYDVRRAGVVPNDVGAATANTTALVALLDPTQTGIQGRVVFPNTTGNDTYYFDGVIEVRSGIHLDLDQCTLSFTKDYEAADDLMGFFTFIRDVTIENGAIDITYDGSAGSNAGTIMRIGSRENYPFGSFTDGINDEDLTDPMGNIVLRNLRLSTTNPGQSGILMLGGLRGVLFENLHIAGNDLLGYAVYYEFGHYHYSETESEIESSHASGMTFRNIFIKDLATAAGAGLSLIGAYSAIVENLEVDTALSVFVFRPGEALFYNVGAPYAPGIKRGISLKNIVGKNIASTAIVLTGAESNDSGYLSGEALTESEQVDLMSFSLDGFAVDEAIIVSGPCSIRNGAITDSGNSGGLIITDECVQFDIDNVKVLDGAASGIRASFTGIWATPRNKIGSIRNCFIAGNATSAIIVSNSESVLIENCRIGYNSLYDSGAEATQTGIVVGATGEGVICRGNHVSVASGVAYILVGTGPRGCTIENARGTATFSGIWAGDFRGTWTPTIIPAASGSITLHPSDTHAEYVKRGNVVTVNAYLSVQSVSSPVGTVKIGGLPFNVANNGDGARTPVEINGHGLGASSTALNARLTENADTMYLYTRFAAGDLTGSAADIEAGATLSLSATYFVDD